MGVDSDGPDFMMIIAPFKCPSTKSVFPLETSWLSLIIINSFVTKENLLLHSIVVT